MTISVPVALYIHVPFCRSRCAYCDFNTYAGLDNLIPQYVKAICREIELARRRWGALSAPTVYFGGGTPSILSSEMLAELFQALHAAFHISRRAEITLEANPGTLTPAYLRSLLGLGINRLSLGVQSAHDDELRLLGRIHTWAQAVEAVNWARAAGVANLSIDLIFGLPGQTVARWRKTLAATLDLKPEHLSLYDLSVEEGTALAQRIDAGTLPAPDEDRAADMYQLAEDMLAEAGFFHYEISSWAHRKGGHRDKGQSQRPKPGKGDRSIVRSEDVSPYVSRHNLTYWRNEPWLGLGAGAHSWLHRRRWANEYHPRDYIAALEQGKVPVTGSEMIDRHLEMSEMMMLRLRLAEGVSADAFERQFGASMEKEFGEELSELQELGLLTWDRHVARLTKRGRLLGNRVFMSFV